MMPFGERKNIFKIILLETKTNKLAYYFAGRDHSFRPSHILAFSKKVFIHPREAYLTEKQEIKNSIITIDLDGTLTDISSLNYQTYSLDKRKLEEIIHKKINHKEFPFEWKQVPEKKHEEVRQKTLMDLAKKDKAARGTREFLEKLSQNGNTLILFSVTSKKRIKDFLKQNRLGTYFTKIYSGKDDFGAADKTADMFKKIKEDNTEKRDFVHIGDQYTRDYLCPKKAGYTAYLVDNSPYKKIFLEEL